MLFSKGKKSVDGNKLGDNKDPKNRSKLTHGQTQKGAVSPHSGNTKIRTQNSPETSSNSEDNEKGINKAASYSKKPTKGRQTIYSDGAIGMAKRARGLE